jgi:hypothetical protein
MLGWPAYVEGIKRKRRRVRTFVSVVVGLLAVALIGAAARLYVDVVARQRLHEYVCGASPLPPADALDGANRR